MKQIFPDIDYFVWMGPIFPMQRFTYSGVLLPITANSCSRVTIRLFLLIQAVTVLQAEFAQMLSLNDPVIVKRSGRLAPEVQEVGMLL